MISNALHTESRGSGTPVLCLHGNPGNWRDFDPLMTRLKSESISFLAVDRPGHGESHGSPNFQKNKYTATQQLSHLILDRFESCYIVGYSMGCYHALRIALVHPEKVKGLLLVAPFIEARSEDKPSSVPKLATSPLGILLKPLMPLLAKKTITNHIEKVLSPLPVSPERKKELLSDYLKVNCLLATMIDKNQICEEPLTFNKLNTISCPITIIQGDKDAVNPGHVKLLTKHLHQSVSKNVEGSGHSVLFTRSDEVAEALLELTTTKEANNAQH
jgi:pimeloyl-ACP methyl ester carboxylesterase